MSSSGYYKWLKRKPGKQKKRRHQLLNRILQIFKDSNCTYGSPRIYKQLRTEGFRCTERTVAELMKKHQISPKRQRKFVKTTDSSHEYPIAQNLLERDFHSKELDEVWVSDITYIETAQGWLYLCVFIDLFSRMVVGWSMSDRLTADIVLDAFEMGKQKQQRSPVVVHSDRGSQYACNDFTKLLEREGCIQSMSRKGDCWDNAVAESFFGSLKSEMTYRKFFPSRIHASTAVFEYIEIFYNLRRLHSSLGFITPWEKVQKGKKVA